MIFSRITPRSRLGATTPNQVGYHGTAICICCSLQCKDIKIPRRSSNHSQKSLGERWSTAAEAGQSFLERNRRRFRSRQHMLVPELVLPDSGRQQLNLLTRAFNRTSLMRHSCFWLLASCALRSVPYFDAVFWSSPRETRSSLGRKDFHRLANPTASTCSTGAQVCDGETANLRSSRQLPWLTLFRWQFLDLV